MTKMGRPKAKLELTDDEREALQRYVRRRSTPAALAQRARIVLRCATGLDNCDVAEDLGITPHTVSRWRRRFVANRLEGLLDEPRVGRPREVDDELVERIVDLTLHKKPKSGTHWSSRLLADEVGTHHSTIARIWKAFGLKPSRSETFSLYRSAVRGEGARHRGAVHVTA